jgi:hypothetical protein
MPEQLYSQIGEFKFDNLISSHRFPILTKGVTLAKTQGVLKRGTVLGVITASGLAKAVDKSKADGSQTAAFILTDDVDTNQATDVKATGYISGVFNGKALFFGGTDTLADHKANLENRKFIISDTISY